LRFSVIIFLIAVTLSIPITGATQVINNDSSSVTFQVSNLGINSVEGTFAGFEGTVLFDEKDLSNSSFKVCIDPATVNSGIAARDKSLLEEDYFDVERYPSICFSSDDIIETEEGFLSKGTLTIKGISKEVSIPFVSKENKLTGSLEINRTAYGVGPSGGFMIGKTVELKIICVLETNNL
jgi:polyisoprenoid-binding protein YceI